MAKIKRIASLLAIAAKMDLVWFLRDTKYALFAMAADFISSASAISSVLLIAARFDGIGGLTMDEVLLMMAFSMVTSGLTGAFASGNNLHVSRIIGRGQLEHMFMQPLTLGEQLLTMGLCPFTGGLDFFAGIGLLIFSIRRLALTVTPGWILLLVGFTVSTVVIIAARAYLVSIAAFYAPVAAEEITSTAVNGTWFLSTFPLSGMPKFIQIPLITLPVLPEGLIAWFPAMCLLGKPPLGLTSAFPMLYALLLSLLAAALFRRGLRHYMLKGSNRYVSHGFRR